MITNINQAWTRNPKAEPGSMPIMNIHAMLVPLRYAPIVTNHRISPTQLSNELGGAIITKADQVKCARLLNWMFMAVTHPTTACPSTVLMDQPVPPLVDATPVCHRRELLYHVLPDGDPSWPPSDRNSARADTYLGQAIDTVRLSRQDTNNRSDAARAPKSASQYFTLGGCGCLMTMCHVSAKGDLPEMWCLLPRYEKGSKPRNIRDSHIDPPSVLPSLPIAYYHCTSLEMTPAAFLKESSISCWSS
jgi:hypothetical protein